MKKFNRIELPDGTTTEVLMEVADLKCVNCGKKIVKKSPVLHKSFHVHAQNGLQFCSLPETYLTATPPQASPLVEIDDLIVAAMERIALAEELMGDNAPSHLMGEVFGNLRDSRAAITQMLNRLDHLDPKA